MHKRHWWNGRWGRNGRRDIYLYDRPWYVEARVGGGDGVSYRYDVDSEEAALALVERFMSDGGEWRELTVRPPEPV